MYKIKHPVEKLNYGKRGIVVITDDLGSILELDCDGVLSYFSKKKFKELLKKGIIYETGNHTNLRG